MITSNSTSNQYMKPRKAQEGKETQTAHWCACKTETETEGSAGAAQERTDKRSWDKGAGQGTQELEPRQKYGHNQAHSQCRTRHRTLWGSLRSEYLHGAEHLARTSSSIPFTLASQKGLQSQQSPWSHNNLHQSGSHCKPNMPAIIVAVDTCVLGL